MNQNVVGNLEGKVDIVTQGEKQSQILLIPGRTATKGDLGKIFKVTRNTMRWGKLKKKQING